MNLMETRSLWHCKEPGDANITMRYEAPFKKPFTITVLSLVMSLGFYINSYQTTMETE